MAVAIPKHAARDPARRLPELVSAVPVGKAANQHHQNGADEGAGREQYRNCGAGQPSVLDYGIVEDRKNVGLARSAAKYDQPRRTDDEPSIEKCGGAWERCRLEPVSCFLRGRTFHLVVPRQPNRLTNLARSKSATDLRIRCD